MTFKHIYFTSIEKQVLTTYTNSLEYMASRLTAEFSSELKFRLLQMLLERNYASKHHFQGKLYIVSRHSNQQFLKSNCRQRSADQICGGTSW